MDKEIKEMYRMIDRLELDYKRESDKETKTILLDAMDYYHNRLYDMKYGE